LSGYLGWVLNSKSGRNSLTIAEEKYKQFQEKYGVYSVSDQVKSAIEVAAKLQSQIVLKEVELGILDRTTTPENENRKNIKIELDELKRQMKNMKFGAPSKDNSIQIFTPFEKAPEIGMQYLNFYREMEIQGKILEILVPLYEQSKIEEQRNIPTVLSLDVAVPAVKASTETHGNNSHHISGKYNLCVPYCSLEGKSHSKTNST